MLGTECQNGKCRPREKFSTGGLNEFAGLIRLTRIVLSVT
jgi:hypothetical protein